jgi:hypothetical protein
VRALGEPFTYGLEPREIGSYLRARGLELLEDLALSEAARLYYPERPPKVSAYYHVVSARCLG